MEHDWSVDCAGRDEIVGLYRAFFREVYAYCARRLFSKDLAEDAASSVFLRLVEQYPKLRAKSRPEIRNWLYGTASNVVAKCLRDADRRRRIASEISQERRRLLDENAAVDDRLYWPSVYEAVAALSPQDQAVVVLRYFEGFESPAIAKALGMTRVGVRVRLYRAIRALRRRLGVTHE